MDTYTEILKCWECVDAVHTDNAYIFEIFEDYYYQLFAPIYD